MTLSNTLFIAGFPRSTSLDTIINLFSPYQYKYSTQEILVAIYPEKKYGFITFNSNKSVVDAIQDSNTPPGIVINNKKVRLEYSKKPVKLSQNKRCREISSLRDINAHSNQEMLVNDYDTDDNQEVILMKPKK